MATLAATPTPGPPPDSPIVRVGSRLVVYRDIAVPAQRRDLSAEQQRLEGILWRELVEAYFAEHHLAVTDDEVQGALPRQLRSPGIEHRVAEAHRAVVAAVNRVRRGEAIEAAYAEELSKDALTKKGITDVTVPIENLRSAVVTLKDQEAIDKYLDRSSDDALRRTYAEYGRRLAQAKKLADYVQKQRAPSARPSTSDLWTELSKSEPTELLNDDYKLPFGQEKHE